MRANAAFPKDLLRGFGQRWWNNPVPVNEMFFLFDLGVVLFIVVELNNVIPKFLLGKIRLHFIEQGRGDHHLPAVTRFPMIEDAIPAALRICQIKGHFGVETVKAVAAHISPYPFGGFAMDAAVFHPTVKVKTAKTIRGFIGKN